MQARHTWACKELGAEDPGRWALTTAEGMHVYPIPSGSGSDSDIDSDDSDSDAYHS
jgi:hypothetical protein